MYKINDIFHQLRLGESNSGMVENSIEVINGEITILINCYFTKDGFIKINQNKISQKIIFSKLGVQMYSEERINSKGFIIFKKIETQTIEKNILGIDVSDDSKEIDFSAWNNQNAKFVIVRTSVCRSNDYYYGSDNARKQIAKAKELGMIILPYHNSHFGADKDKAIKEADYAIKKATDYGVNNKGVIALDYEWTDCTDKEKNTEAVIAFMTRIQDKGYKPLLYCGIDYLRNKLNINHITALFGNCLWFANYKSSGELTEPDLEYFHSLHIDDIVIWQWTNKWKVDSIPENSTMDGNILIKDLEVLN